MLIAYCSFLLALISLWNISN